MNYWSVSASLHVIRSGSWGVNPQGAQVAFRYRRTPDYPGSFLGVRLVRRCV